MLLPLALAAAVAAAEGGVAGPWSAAQATGAPDTPIAEDAPTAWCPREPDAGKEWLVVRFARAVPVAELRVRESLGPGAVARVSLLLAGGGRRSLWRGQDPTTEAPGDLVVRPRRPVTGRAFVIELDTERVKGWNAGDAVELVGTDGSRQWASEATASSSYEEVGGLLAGELSPAARRFADDGAGLRMRAPGWWIRANPALLAAPGEVLAAWTRDGKAMIALLRARTDAPWTRDGLAERTAELAAALGAEIQAREVQDLGGMRAVGLVVSGTEEESGARIRQHWVAVPRRQDVLLFLLSSPANRYDADDEVFRRMLSTAELQGEQTAEQKATK